MIQILGQYMDKGKNLLMLERESEKNTSNNINNIGLEDKKEPLREYYENKIKGPIKYGKYGVNSFGEFLR